MNLYFKPTVKGVITVALNRQQKFMVAGYAAIAIALWSMSGGDDKQVQAPKPTDSSKISNVLPDTVGVFEGLRVPGSAADAKAAGLNVCEVTHYSMECAGSNKGKLLGVEVGKISVSLNGDNHLNIENQERLTGDVRKMPLDALSYASIQVALSEASADALQAALLKDGWESWEWRRYTYFMKNGQHIELSIDRRYSDRINLAVRYASDAGVAERLQMLAAKRAEKAAAEANAKALVEQMKN